MSLSSLRRRVNALNRQLIVPLGVVRLRPIIEQYCDEWDYATSQGSVLPPCTPADPVPPKKTPTPLGAHRRGVPASVPSLSSGASPTPAFTYPPSRHSTGTCASAARKDPVPSPRRFCAYSSPRPWPGLLPRFPRAVDC